MIRKQSVFFLCIWASMSVVFAQEIRQELSLNQLIDSALQNNYLLKANEKNTLVKQAEIEILKANYLPKISTMATFSYWYWLMPNKQKLLGDAFTDMYTDISVYQTVYDWGENKLKKAIVKDEIQMNEEVRSQIRSTIMWGVANTYFEALKTESEIETHQNSLQQLKDQLRYAENLYKISKVSSVDVLKVNIQISVEERNLQKAQNEFISQLIKIKRLCNLNSDEYFNIENRSSLLFEKNKSITFIPDSLYRDVFLNHPALLITDRKMVLEEKQKSIYRLQNRPELFSYGIASWEDNYIPFGDNFNFNIGIGIRYTIPYLGGSGYKSKMLQSTIKIEQMKDEKNELFLNIQKEIDLALNTIKDIKDEISGNEKIISLTNETLTNALIKYQAGQGSIIDVLDAQSILTETTIAYNKSIISYLQSMITLHYLTGSNNYPF